ncbi:hypothetical protein B5E87_02780 [Massilimicrobiota sp. An142]|uniref:lipopolysaccharide biosynthesis protein n=1 Tax=Massilimicrobiota sp. An142 TaxID=1965564 RepID=UPI000B3760AE|nr:oligosaccharide flippase family protein [Massilimicrobiota sp. An142]OUQ14424.1 hypothetical protein B5E87_02780 [Massilimicrobiota sp. An142]
MKKIKNFFKTAGIFFLGNVFTKLVSFFLLPLYTSKIEPNAFGNYNLTISVMNIIVPICYLSIWDGIFRFSFDYEEEERKYQVFNIGFPVMIFGTIILIFIILMINMLVDIDNVILVSIYGILSAFQYFYTVIARSLKNNKLFVMSGCINTTIALIINVILITYLNLGVESFYISYIFGVLIQLILIEQHTKFLNKIEYQYCFDKLRQFLKFSVPLTLTAISNWLLNGVTQVFIVYFLGSYYNGLYSVANKFSSVLLLAISVFQFAWNELAYDMSSIANRKLYYQRGISEILKYSIVGLSLLIIAVKFIFPIMIDLKYVDSYPIVPILLIGSTAGAYASFIGTIYLAEKKSSHLVFSTLLTGIFNVILTIIAIKCYGFLGAVSSLSLALILLVLQRIMDINKLFSIKPEINSLYPLSCLLVSIILYYLIDDIVINVLSTIIVVIIVLLILKDSVINLLNEVKKND